MKKRARLTVLAGPTAVGKGTVVRAVRQRHPHLFVSVSATTRPARPGEVDGVDYHFVEEAAFDAMVAEGGFLEWAVVHGRHRYGTLRGPVENELTKGNPVLLEIDLQGARQIHESMPEARMIFLDPPSWEELENRLVGRGTENAAERERRLETARRELQAKAEFHHVVVNNEVAEAADEVAHLAGLE